MCIPLNVGLWLINVQVRLSLLAPNLGEQNEGNGQHKEQIVQNKACQPEELGWLGAKRWHTILDRWSSYWLTFMIDPVLGGSSLHG